MVVLGMIAATLATLAVGAGGQSYNPTPIALGPTQAVATTTSSNTAVMGAPAGSTVTVTEYWNIPAGAEKRADVQRWARLR